MEAARTREQDVQDAHAGPSPSARPPASRDRMRAWERDVRLRRLLAGADALAVMAVVGAVGLRSNLVGSFPISAAAVVLLALVVAKGLGLYDRDQRLLLHTTVDELSFIVSWSALVTVATVIGLRAFDEPLPSASVIVVLLVGLALMDIGLRAAARQLWRQFTPPERIVIVGSGASAAAARRKFGVFGDLHVQLLGAIDEREAFHGDGEFADRGRFARLSDLAGGVDRILIATPTVDEHLVSELVPFCRAHAIKLGIIPPARGMLGTAVLLDHLAELPIIQYNTWDVSRTTLIIKRAMDVVIAGVSMLACLALLPVIALLVRLDSRGPVLFRQVRGGQGGRPFRMLKFRTMIVDAESRLKDVLDVEGLPSPVFKLEDDPRITRVGRLLRRTSLDELPQLWNVLRGDMSIVGPRPEQLDLVKQYPPEVRRVRLAVKPGLTGPMQVSGRGQLTMEERLAVEREYVENLSIARDVRILGRTASAVFRGRGAY